RHLDWFVRASEPANALRHPDAYASWPAIEADTDNFRAAVGWALEQRAVHPLALLSWNLFPWYWQSGRLLEARDWLDEAVALVDPDTAPIDAARLRLWAGMARFQTGDLEGAAPMVTSATTTFRELGDETDAAVAQIMHAGVSIGSARPDEVDDELDGALKVMRSHGIDWGVGYAAFTLGSLAELRGDLAAPAAPARIPGARGLGQPVGEPRRGPVARAPGNARPSVGGCTRGPWPRHIPRGPPGRPSCEPRSVEPGAGACG